MKLAHLKAGDKFIELWGGPLYAEAVGLSAGDEAELAEFGCVLEYHSWWPTDRGGGWRKRLVLAGVEVTAVKLDRQGRAVVRLPEGGWLLLDAPDGEDLAEEALILGIFTGVEGPEEERQTWRSLGVRAISITKPSGDRSLLDPYSLEDV